MIFDFIRLWKSAKIKAEERELRPYGRTTVYDRITIGELFDEHFVFPFPKQDLMYVYDDFTLRQTLEKWENNRYASIPVLNRKGEYVGTLTEGDILWGLKQQHGLDIEAAEDVPISSFAHKRDYKAVTVTTSMDQLIEAAMNQNFVPVRG